MSIHINLDDEDYSVETYGGEHYHNCEDCGNCDFNSYGIRIDNLFFEITGKTAYNLVNALRKHLENNGHKFDNINNFIENGK